MIVCVSHEGDVDGLCSAALIKSLKDAKVILVDYGDFLKTLEALSGVKELYLCDLGLNKANFKEFTNQVIRLSSKIFYFDHHPQTLKQRRELEKLGVKVYHSNKECSSMLVYSCFKDILPKEAELLALYGAITDYMDNSPLSKVLMGKYDRIFLLLEASLLAFAIGRRNSKDFLLNLVDSLSKFQLPHKIDEVNKLALEYLDLMDKNMEILRKEGISMEKFAYIIVKEGSSGLLANMIKGIFNVEVGLALKDEDPYYDISLRASNQYKKHLGRIVERIAKGLGGTGGGHPRAAGCRIKKDKLEEFLNKLKELI